jgi:hypothetical protein
MTLESRLAITSKEAQVSRNGPYIPNPRLGLALEASVSRCRRACKYPATPCNVFQWMPFVTAEMRQSDHWHQHSLVLFRAVIARMFVWAWKYASIHHRRHIILQDPTHQLPMHQVDP